MAPLVISPAAPPQLTGAAWLRNMAARGPAALALQAREPGWSDQAETATLAAAASCSSRHDRQDPSKLLRDFGSLWGAAGLHDLALVAFKVASQTDPHDFDAQRGSAAARAAMGLRDGLSNASCNVVEIRK